MNSEGRSSRLIVALQAAYADMNKEIQERIAQLLRPHSGKVDLLREVHGCVRLMIVISETGRECLLGSIESGELTELAGYRIMSVEVQGSPVRWLSLHRPGDPGHLPREPSRSSRVGPRIADRV